MGLFGFGKKKEPPHAFLMPFFEDALKVLMEFNNSDSLEDEDRRGFAELMLSASALVIAGYHMKYYMAYDGHIERKKASEISTNIGEFMYLVANTSLRAAEKETDRRYDPDDWRKKVIDLQHDKSRIYSVAILETIKKGRGAATGIDISDAVTEDLYSEAVPDIMLGIQLFSIVAQIKE
jgi:hypothetical protein